LDDGEGAIDYATFLPVRKRCTQERIDLRPSGAV
jgi:hypothetical protein